MSFLKTGSENHNARDTLLQLNCESTTVVLIAVIQLYRVVVPCCIILYSDTAGTIIDYLSTVVVVGFTRYNSSSMTKHPSALYRTRTKETNVSEFPTSLPMMLARARANARGDVPACIKASMG